MSTSSEVRHYSIVEEYIREEEMLDYIFGDRELSLPKRISQLFSYYPKESYEWFNSFLEQTEGRKFYGGEISHFTDFCFYYIKPNKDSLLQIKKFLRRCEFEKEDVLRECLCKISGDYDEERCLHPRDLTFYLEIISFLELEESEIQKIIETVSPEILLLVILVSYKLPLSLWKGKEFDPRMREFDYEDLIFQKRCFSPSDVCLRRSLLQKFYVDWKRIISSIAKEEKIVEEVTFSLWPRPAFLAIESQLQHITDISLNREKVEGLISELRREALSSEMSLPFLVLSKIVLEHTLLLRRRAVAKSVSK